MNILKKITTAAFIGLGLSSIAQNNSRMDKIDAISKKVISACETGAQSIMDLSDKNKENASLYSEYYKQDDYAMALKFWRPLFFEAPKHSENLHLRGINIYTALASKAEGELKEAYLDTMYAIHEARVNCFGGSSKLEQSRAFDWYSYRGVGNEDLVFGYFNNVHDKLVKEGSENDADPTFILYWAKAAVKADKKTGKLGAEGVLEIFETIGNIVDANVAAGNDQGKYVGAMDAVTEQLKEEGYLDPAKLMEIAEKKFRANPNDETTIIKAYNSLKACGSECTNTELFTDIIENLVKVRPSSGLYQFLASKAQKANKDSDAIGYLNKAIALETKSSDKSDLLYKIATIYLGNGSLSNARDYARKMLDLNSNSGLAYIIIGNTYASSGKICGTGTDFASHTVSWAAIDTWQKAKSVDSSVADEAQRLINKYSQYMPSKEELFYNNIAVGSSYTISCLGVTTTVRASN